MTAGGSFPGNGILDFIEYEADRSGALAESALRWPRHNARAALRKALGIPDGESPPPAVQQIGGVDSPPVHVERLLLNLVDGFTAPANVFRPIGRGPWPGVLYSVGHWMSEGRLAKHVLEFCTGMASLGFVVLAFDPLGQGERGPTFDDHGRLDLLPIGKAHMVMHLEHVRALDYLADRPDVDGDRLGMTGASGGGLNTVYTAALDERVRAAAPVCYVIPLRRMLRVMRGSNWNSVGDICNQVPGIIRSHEMAGLCGLIAPRPLMIVSATDDALFPAHAGRRVAALVEPLYVGASDRLEFRVVPGVHEYNRAMRVAVYDWFVRWLAIGSRSDPSNARETLLVGTEALKCRPTGPSTDEGFDALARDGVRVARLARGRLGLRASPRSIRRVLGLDAAPQPKASSVGRVVADGRLTLVLEPEPHSLTLLDLPNQDDADLISAMRLLISDRSDGPNVRPTASAVLWPRTFGELAATPPRTMMSATLDGGESTIRSRRSDHLEFEIATDSLMLGRSLLGQQVLDLEVALEQLFRMFPLERLEVLCDGPRASLVGLFGVRLRPKRVTKVVLSGLLCSFEDLVGRKSRRFPLEGYLHDVLRHFDIPDVIAGIPETTEVVVLRPVDGQRRRVGIVEARSRLGRDRPLLVRSTSLRKYLAAGEVEARLLA